MAAYSWRMPSRMRPHPACLRVLVSLLMCVTALVLCQPATALADFVGSGAHPWAIVLCNFSNQTTDPASATYFDTMYGDAGAGSGRYNFEDWWHDVSFGQLSVAGTTVITGSHADADGWYTASESRDAWSAKDRYDKIVDCENAALPDVNYNNYYGVIAIFPEAAGKTTAAIGAADTAVTINDSSSSTANVTTTNYWPTPPFLMNVDDGSGNNNETVNVTAAHDNGDGTETFTISRGANGTTAKSHNANAGAGVPGDFGEVTGGSHPGTAPGPSYVSLSDGHTYTLAQVILPNEANLSGAGHETGHGFGYNHSRKLSYSTTDYKDATDIMSVYDGPYEYTSLGTSFGGAVLGSATDDKGPGLDAIDLDFQGWIPSGRHYLFNNGSPPNQATITLHALSDPNALGDSSDYLEARVPAAVTIEDASANDSNGNPLPPTNPATCSPSPYSCATSQYYTVEYRQQTGWDSGFPASAVVLHLFGNDNRSYWVDQLPDGHNGLLLAGDEYVDAAHNTYVAINAISGSSARVTLGSAKITPSLVYSGDTSGDYNDQVTLAGDLTVGGAPIPNASVTLSLGTQSCAGTTNAAGHVSCALTLTQDPGAYTASASYSGDTAYNGASGNASFTLLHEDTKVTYTGATSGDYHDAATVSGYLTDPTDNTPIAGKQLTFTIGASDTCSATTNGSGFASCSITPQQVPAAYAMSAAFAGDTDYASSSDTSQTFTITKEETSTAYTGPTVILQGGSGVTLKGSLLEDAPGNAAAPISGRTLTLSLGSQSCTGTTDATGTATCTLIFTGPLGPQPLAATFAGDAYYLPSSDTSQVATVFAFPSRGVFALGDSTVGAATPTTSLTWWAATWNTLNSLSGGAAPASFKGFVASPSLPTSSPPTVCGGNWTSAPGDSSTPPSSVPSYMGVVVTSSVSKSGSTISGNTTHIVVVRTQPGYGPNPGSSGVGTIVATYC